MIEINVAFDFEASHTLENHAICSRMHGHSWKIIVTLKGNIENDGMVMDFDLVKKHVNEFKISYLDHFHLNHTTVINPTCENLAKWCFEKLKLKLPKLYSVTIYETPYAWAVYKL